MFWFHCGGPGWWLATQNSWGVLLFCPVFFNFWHLEKQKVSKWWETTGLFFTCNQLNLSASGEVEASQNMAEQIWIHLDSGFQCQILSSFDIQAIISSFGKWSLCLKQYVVPEMCFYVLRRKGLMIYVSSLWCYC